MITLQGISEQFAELGFEPSDQVLDKCIDLCVTYDITDPVEFVEQWMAFSVSNLNGAEPTVEYLTDMERKELSHKKDASTAKKSKKPTSSLSSIADVNSLRIYGTGPIPSTSGTNDVLEDDDIMDSYICNTPKTPRTILSRTPARQNSDVLFSPVSYSPISGIPRSSLPDGSGKIVYTYGSGNLIKQATWSSTRQEKITIKQILSHNNETMNIKSKYMFDGLMDKSTILGDRIYNIGLEICKKVFGEDTIDYDLHNVDVPSHDTVKTVGRISCDFDGKLDPASTILIGSDEMKYRSVRLNFSKSKPFGIFPGQTVMLSGTNPRGNTFYVEEIITERTLCAPSKPELNEPLTFVIASGPYTNHDDLVYDPLHDLILYCKDHKPDVVIMTGPFMEADHSLIASNVLAETFESFFEKMVGGVVEALGDNTTICMISSHKDAVSNMVYPTHPNIIKKCYPNVYMLPDPCIIDVDGLKIGITSTDIVEHLLEEELALNAGDKVKRVVNYLFNQGSFYPLNPPSFDVCFDSDLASKFAKLDAIPNIMILPSKQKYFIRDVNGCLAINPGHLTNKLGGTFARLVVHPQKEDASLVNSMACQVMKV